MNNRINQLEAKYDMLRKNCEKWEKVIKNIKSETTEQIIVTVGAIAECENLETESINCFRLLSRSVVLKCTPKYAKGKRLNRFTWTILPNNCWLLSRL